MNRKYNKQKNPAIKMRTTDLRKHRGRAQTNAPSKEQSLYGNYFNPACFATSSAKFSSLFSIPSPVSKRTKRLMESVVFSAFAT